MSSATLTPATPSALALNDELGEVEYERLIKTWFRCWQMPPDTPLHRANRTPAQRAAVQQMARHQCREFADDRRTR